MVYGWILGDLRFMDERCLYQLSMLLVKLRDDALDLAHHFEATGMDGEYPEYMSATCKADTFAHLLGQVNHALVLVEQDHG